MIGLPWLEVLLDVELPVGQTDASPAKMGGHRIKFPHEQTVNFVQQSGRNIMNGFQYCCNGASRHLEGAVTALFFDLARIGHRVCMVRFGG